jgi:hypothetical protein
MRGTADMTRMCLMVVGKASSRSSILRKMEVDRIKFSAFLYKSSPHAASKQV